MRFEWKKYSYFILLLYMLAGFFIWPSLGIIALVCMLAPVILAPFHGRKWCGMYCPRGSLWDSVFAKIITRRQVPTWAKNNRFRVFMLLLIFTVFGVQMYFAWPDWNEIGLVFLRIILVTTLVGILLAFLYSPRTWCNFCPMGTLAAWSSTKRKGIQVSDNCVSCNLCAKVCPMNLRPQDSKGNIFIHADCIKCQECINACPKKALTM